MEESEDSNNYSLNQTFNKDKNEQYNEINSRSIQSFVSINYSRKSPNNSNNLEDIIFKELKDYEKSYIDNGIILKKRIEGSNPNTKRTKKDSLFNLDSNSENSEKHKNDISRSDQLLSMNKHSLFKSFNQINNLQLSPNKNYIPDSDSEEEKEKNEDEEKESEYANINSEKDSISIRISNPNIINNNSRNNSNQTFNSHKELISSLKNFNMNLPEEKRSSLINNFSRVNSILSSRNTISFVEKPNYQLLAYSIFNNSSKDTNKSRRIAFNSKQSVNYSEQARIIQKWWRNVKAICDDKLNKIIKIQSVWRGKCTRKYILEIIYFIYSCESFCDILSQIFINKIKIIWKLLFRPDKKENDIITKAKKLFNRYQYIKPFFEKWKCLNKLILFKVDINKNTIITKRKIKIRHFKEMKKFEEYYDEKTRTQMKLMEENNIKALYLNCVYLKLRMNKIRYTFDCLYKHDSHYNLHFKKYSKFPKRNGDNNSIKKYFLYKWRNIIKYLEIKELKEKLLKFLLIKYFKKSSNNALKKYFSRWKIIADDEKNKSDIKLRIKRNKKENIRKNKKLKELIKLSIYFKRKNHIILMRELLRKWRFLIFAKKMAHQKLLKMYEVVQKTYGKMVEDIYDFDKIKEEKYNMINNNSIEDEKNFIEHFTKLYNGKFPNKFKLNNKINNKK